VYFGFHQRTFLAFELSHSKKSTSDGRKYFLSISTKHFHVFLSYHFSSIHSHLHSITIQASSKDQLTNSLTEYDSQVDITKSCGISCCNIIHIAST
jgi:hypothetical protein